MLKNITIKKVALLITALVMSLNLCITAFAEEGERIEIFVEDEAEIEEFLLSAEYNPYNRYSFIMENKVQPRISCPKCGHSGYKGYTEEENVNVVVRMCPDAPDTFGDVCSEMHVYGYSACDYCGYKTKKTYGYRYWIVECHNDFGGPYIAKPGKSYLDGFNPHEDPDYMGLT